MNVHDAVRIAIEYLYANHVELYFPKPPIGCYRLDRGLQYELCTAFGRMDGAHPYFHEISCRDVIHLVEAWIMAQAAADHQQLYLLRHDASDFRPLYLKPLVLDSCNELVEKDPKMKAAAWEVVHKDSL